MAAVARSRADQILCGTNKTRHAINAAVRRERGLGDWLPAAGERLVCLQNRHGLGLLNGTIWIVLQAVTGRGRETGREMVKLDLASEEGFVEFGLPVDRFFEYFDFGYALIVHKAQGSEWDSVMLVDESRVFGNEADRWRYTGITRASRRLTLARRLRGRRSARSSTSPPGCWPATPTRRSTS